MNIEIFNRNYWVRRFGEQQYYHGYYYCPHDDYVASLHVHPLGAMKILALPEGDMSFQHLEAHGSHKLQVVGELGGDTRGDLLWYQGHWWECISVVEWHDTGLLSHFNYEFAFVTQNAAGDSSLSNPPTEDPDDYAETRHLPVSGS